MSLFLHPLALALLLIGPLPGPLTRCRLMRIGMQVATVQPLSAEAVEAMGAATHALPVKSIYANDERQYFERRAVAAGGHGGHGTIRHAKQAMATIAAEYAAQQAAAGTGNAAGAGGTLYRAAPAARSPDGQIGQSGGTAGYYWPPQQQMSAQMGMSSQMYVYSYN